MLAFCYFIYLHLTYNFRMHSESQTHGTAKIQLKETKIFHKHLKISIREKVHYYLLLIIIVQNISHQEIIIYKLIEVILTTSRKCQMKYKVCLSLCIIYIFILIYVLDN